jgi:hypothetical protein
MHEVCSVSTPSQFADPTFFVDTGAMYATMLRDLATGESATEDLRTDWMHLSAWLGCQGNQLTPQNLEAVRLAWRAYLAIGLAPSESLQPVFDLVSANLKRTDPDCKKDRPPTEIMDVFDRMLATRGEIAKKRALDIAAESERLKAAFARAPSAGVRKSFWRRQSAEFRQRVFISAVWAVGTLLLFSVFDPLDFGEWDSWNDDELLQVAFVMCLPVMAWDLRVVYERFVK